MPKTLTIRNVAEDVNFSDIKKSLYYESVNRVIGIFITLADRVCVSLVQLKSKVVRVADLTVNFTRDKQILPTRFFKIQS